MENENNDVVENPENTVTDTQEPPAPEPQEPQDPPENNDDDARAAFADALKDVTESDDDEGEEEEEAEEGEENTDDNQQEKPDEKTDETSEKGEKPEDKLDESQLDESERDLLSRVKDKRSRERVKQWITDHNKLKQEATAMAQQNQKFAEIVRGTGMNGADFAKTLEFCRLSRSEDEANLKIALELIEAEREAIYDKLGKTAPGTDIFKGYDDLKKRVDEMEIPEDVAKEYIRLKKQEERQKAQQQEVRQMSRQQQDMTNRINAFTQQAVAQFQALEKADANFKAKEKAIVEYLQKPGVIQHLVEQVPPESWAFYMKSLYDSVSVPVATPAPVKRKTPISSKSTRLNAPQITGNTAGEIFGSALQQVLGQ